MRDKIMAGAATHIAIADKIYSVLGENIIKNLPLFFGGNIAPDAIHEKQGYQRADKKRTHFTEEISEEDFLNPEKIKIFHRKVNNFIENYYLTSTEQKDLYLGYIIHLLTDVLFNQTVRERFVERMKKDGIEQTEREFGIRIMTDIEGADYIIAHKYGYTQNIVEVLKSAHDYEIKDYITKTEMNKRKDWAISTLFNEISPPQVDLKYYCYEEAVDFINSAAKDIIICLSGKSDIIKII